MNRERTTFFILTCYRSDNSHIYLSDECIKHETQGHRH